MKFALPDLPYSQDALEPVISKRTMFHHYEKHHASYVKKLESALDDSRRDDSLEQIIGDSYRREDASVFNPAAQVWNHTFYWNSMSPDNERLKDERLISLIDASFGSVDKLLQEFRDAVLNQFGSGWAWLLASPDGEPLQVKSTTDAVNPLPGEFKPLLTVDVWEHAYYLDYQQDRAAYVDGFLDKLVNWRFAAENLDR